MAKPLGGFGRGIQVRGTPQRVTRVRAQFQEDLSENVPERIVLPLPEGATQPSQEPVVPPAWFGFVENAERINSRFAMIGFFGIVLVEAIFGKGVLELMGIAVGSGLGFEL